MSGLQHHSPCESGDRAVTIHCLLGLGHSCLRYNKEFSTTVTKPKGFHAYAISLCHLSRRLRGRKNTVVMYQAPVFIEYRNNNIKKALWYLGNVPVIVYCTFLSNWVFPWYVRKQHHPIQKEVVCSCLEQFCNVFLKCLNKTTKCIFGNKTQGTNNGVFNLVLNTLHVRMQVKLAALVICPILTNKKHNIPMAI